MSNETTPEVETVDETTSGWRKYDHLQRMGHRFTRGIQEGTVFVFPKFDGTNASVWSDGTTVFAGSRNRQLGVDAADNAGFNTWLQSDDERAVRMRAVALANPSFIFYGEWLVPHTLKTYADDAWRKFYIFDVLQRGAPGVAQRYVPFTEYQPMLAETHLPHLPPIAILENPTGAAIKACLDGEDFLIADGEGCGEGIVVKNYEWRNAGSHDRVWGKHVRTEFKVSAKMKVQPTRGDDLEPAIAQEFVTDTLVQKNLAKVLLNIANELVEAKTDETVSSGTWTQEYMIANYRGRIIPQLLGRVWRDILDEEMAEIVKRYKRPTINFSTLMGEVNRATKSLATEVF